MPTVDIECVCPKTPHKGDTVTLRETLDFRSALAIRNAFVLLRGEEPEASVGELLATLTEQYLLFGIESWTLVDADGQPLPVSKTTIRAALLSHPDIASVVGDAADAAYAEKVVLPLLIRASGSSPATPTEPSTSATTDGSTESPTPFSQSWTSTSPTDDIAETSALPVGVSS